MKRLLSLVLIGMFSFPALAQDAPPIDWYERLKISGSVQSHDNKVKEAAIVNDVIVWAGKRYLLSDSNLTEDSISIDGTFLVLDDVDTDGVSITVTTIDNNGDVQDSISLFYPKRK